jgi:phage host-nuclease inhibitor protein Gam
MAPMDHEPEPAGTSAAAHRMSGETVAPVRGTRRSMASIRLLPAIALRRPRVLGATLGLLLFTFAAFGMLAVHNFASADIESAVGQLAHATTEKQRLTAEMEQEITLIRARYEGPLGTLAADLETITDAAAEWAARNPAEFGNRKSLALTHGTIGWRTGNPTLKPLSGWTWDRVLEKLTTQEDWMRFVRTKAEVAKDLLLADREILADTTLKSMGVQVVQNEPFFIEPKLTAIETRLQTA